MPRLPVPPELTAFLARRGTFVLVSHMDPDGDCLGSSMALAHFLSRLGNRVIQLNPGPFDRLEVRDLSARFERHLADALQRASDGVFCVILDASTIDRVGDLRPEIEHLPTAVIDHHSSGTPHGDIRYIDSSSPATSFLVHRTMEAMGYEPDAEEAESLLFALATDTGYFRFLDSSAGDVMESAGRLIRAGAAPDRIYGRMFGGRSLGSRKLLGELLRRTEAHCDGRLLVCWQTSADEHAFGNENKDSASLYQLLMTVEGCEAIVFLRETPEGACTGSLRSSNHIDVGVIASAYGGGGHARAAGFLTVRPLGDLKRELIDTFGRAFSAPRPD